MSSSPVPPASSACTSRARCSMRARDVTGVDNLDPYYDVDAEGSARRARLRRDPRFELRARRSRRRAGVRSAVRARTRSRRSCTSPRSRACAIRSSIRTRTCATTSSRSATCSKRCRHCRDRAPRLRVVVVRLRRESRAAVLRGPARRPSGQPVRGDQEGERADGAQLQPPVPAADDGAALLHRVRTVGPARPGADAVHEGDRRGAADRRLQPRRHGARLHVHRRHRRRRRADPRASAAAERTGNAPYAIYNIGNHDGGRRSDTFIATARSGCSAGARSATSGRCSRATSRRRTRRSSDCSAATGFAPRTPLADGLARFVDVVPRLLSGDVSAA